MSSRGIRGATTADEDTEAAILSVTRELLLELIAANSLVTEDLAAIFFTCTPDLTTAFPAKAARELGLGQVPLLCSQELDVQGALTRCVRVLVLANTERKQAEMRHVYLRGAKVLRPELAAR